MTQSDFNLPLLPCAAEAYLPHDAPMALVDQIVDVEPGRLMARVDIHPDCQFADADGVPVWVGIEYMAQTIAAYGGVLATTQGQPVKIGFLVSARRVQCAVDAFGFGDVLDVEAREINMPDDGLATFDCQVLRDGQSLMSARINVYQPADPLRYLQENA
ncbi:MAG: hotdog family protein [Abyssibacter sp.]|uniref:hotdog family protein n=1 Tax=Abyssibacter sp. TaxID=2320200 RepID=UPI00321A07C9